MQNVQIPRRWGRAEFCWFMDTVMFYTNFKLTTNGEAN